MNTFDFITIGDGQVSVNQGDGVFAHVSGSVLASREPAGVWSEARERSQGLWESRRFVMPKGVKWCSQCGDNLPHECFTAKADQRDGLHPYCNKCRADLERKRYASTLGRDVRPYRRKATA